MHLFDVNSMRSLYTESAELPFESTAAFARLRERHSCTIDSAYIQATGAFTTSIVWALNCIRTLCELECIGIPIGSFPVPSPYANQPPEQCRKTTGNHGSGCTSQHYDQPSSTCRSKSHPSKLSNGSSLEMQTGGQLLLASSTEAARKCLPVILSVFGPVDSIRRPIYLHFL